MKKAILSMLAAGLSAATFAAANNDVLTFSTKGPDTYADGGTVLDGECYALVWVKDGCEFAGLTVSGDIADSVNNKLLLVAPCAAGGRCPTVMFEIDAEYAKGLAGGSYSVYLLDTRVTSASGEVKVAGVDSSGKLATVNGYGAVSSSAAVSTEGGVPVSKEGSDGKSGATGETIAAAAAIPAGRTQPKIKDVRVIGDKVFLTVEKIAGATIRVQGAGTANPAAFTQIGDDVATDSTPAEDVLIVRPAIGSSGFFRAINR